MIQKRPVHVQINFWKKSYILAGVPHINPQSEHSVEFTEYIPDVERWGAGVETQKNVRGEIGGWGRVPFNETYAPSLSTIYDGA